MGVPEWRKVPEQGLPCPHCRRPGPEDRKSQHRCGPSGAVGHSQASRSLSSRILCEGNKPDTNTAGSPRQVKGKKLELIAEDNTGLKRMGRVVGEASHWASTGLQLDRRAI